MCPSRYDFRRCLRPGCLRRTRPLPHPRLFPVSLTVTVSVAVAVSVPSASTSLSLRDAEIERLPSLLLLLAVSVCTV